MKQSDITKKVIELSKKIAEHWRMEIYVGGWICLIQIKRGKQKFNPELVDGKIFWIAVWINFGSWGISFASKTNLISMKWVYGKMWKMKILQVEQVQISTKPYSPHFWRY